MVPYYPPRAHRAGAAWRAAQPRSAYSLHARHLHSAPHLAAERAMAVGEAPGLLTPFHVRATKSSCEWFSLKCWFL